MATRCRCCDRFTSSGALPEIRSCAESYGTITAAGSKTLAGVKITACIGDQQSAMAGQRCFREGMAKTTYGTGAFTLINTGYVDPVRVVGR